MGIALITITHNRIGAEIVSTAEEILGSLPMATRHVPVRTGDDADAVAESLDATMKELDQGGGVLILADLYGSTPCNIAIRTARRHNARVVSGINLPMLLRVCNYAGLGLREVAERAAEGGRIGIGQYDGD